LKLLERVTGLLNDPPPSMAFEVSEAGIAAARLGATTEMTFHALKAGAIVPSPVKENVADPDAFTLAVRALAGTNGARKRRDVALLLPDACARTAVLDFDNFPSDAREQLSLVRFRLKRSLPFDIDAAAVSYHAQPAGGKRTDVVVVVAPVEILAQYEAPFRSSGMHPGLVTTAGLAALELAPEHGVSVMAKLAGHTLTVMVRERGVLKLARCLEASSAQPEDLTADLFSTLVYIEDHMGARAGKLFLCGFGEAAATAARRFEEELGVEVAPVTSPFGAPGEHNAGLLGYLRGLAREN
jgi:type IV pilus assembly protein PilM